MNRRKLFGKRVYHTVFLTLLIAIVLIEGIQSIVPMWEFVVAAGIIVSWMLGQRHERQIVIGAGLADREELRSAERDAQTWFSW